MISIISKVVDLVLTLIYTKYLEKKHNIRYEKAKRIAKNRVIDRRKRINAKRVVRWHRKTIIKVVSLIAALIIGYISIYIASGNSILQLAKNIATLNIMNGSEEDDSTVFDGEAICDCKGKGSLLITAKQLNDKGVKCDGTYRIVVEYCSNEFQGFEDDEKEKTIIAYSVLQNAYDEDKKPIKGIDGVNVNGELNFDASILVNGKIYRKDSYSSASYVDECKITSSKEKSYFVLNTKYSDALKGGVLIYGYNWKINRVYIEESDQNNNWEYSSVVDSHGNGNNTVSVIGNATGKYAVQLDDGSYFWYHQTSTNSSANFNCDYCGGSDVNNNWSNMTWSNDSSLFGRNACAIYSMACITSNLTGTEITPIKLLEDIGGVKSLKSDGTLWMDTSNIDVYAGGHSMTGGGRAVLVPEVSSLYGLKYSEISGKTAQEKIASIDEVLNKKGYVWASWKNSLIPWYNGSSTHFMVIRKADGDNYYCFTSCNGKSGSNGKYTWKFVSGVQGCVDTMNTPVAKEDVINAMTDMQAYGIWNENLPTISSSSSNQNGSWYLDLDQTYNGQGKIVSKFDGWMDLYDGPTCVASNISYKVDITTTMNDIVNNFNTYTGGMKKGYTNWSAAEFYTEDRMRKQANLRKFSYTLNEGSVAMTNGRYVVAVGPGIVNRDYYANTSGVGNSAAPYSYGTKLIDIVLKEKATGNIYYVPLTTGDSKAHDYPYGICQTNIHIPDSSADPVSVYCWSGNGGVDETIGSIDSIGEAGIVAQANQLINSHDSRYDVSQALNNGIIEWCYLGGLHGSRIPSLNNTFDLMEVIVYN